MNDERQQSRRQFVQRLAAGGAALLSLSREPATAQDPVVSALATEGRSSKLEKIPWKAQPFPMKHVKLGPGPCKDATEAIRSYLHFLPEDRLLHMFRVTAGFPSSAEPLGGWEKPDCELRGHFTGGHFLSACALMYATAGDEDLKRKGNSMVAELAKCQKALSGGYLGAYPTELYDRLKSGKKVWAPFYTYHKIMAGHLDMFTHCGNEQALEVAEGMARWVANWTKPITEAHMQEILQVEHGGMNEVLFNLYAVTGKDEYVDLAYKFDHKKVFNPLAEHRDDLTGLHANTNIPKITGVARGYELTGDHRYHEIANYFWHEVVDKRTYCTGGTSSDEHWRTPPGQLASEMTKDTEECCCGYNMLKLTRHIFGWTADPGSMDYYERTLFNSRLGTINLADNGMSYFLPLATGYWKYFNTPLDSFWCCTGTGVEEYSKLGDTIYFHDDHGIYVNLFVASEVDWPEKGVQIRQETNFPEEEGSTLVVAAKSPTRLTVHVRAPYWATSGITVKINGKPENISVRPGSYLSISREWKDGDKLAVSMPMALHIAPLPGDESRQAVMYGPLVLAGRLGAQGLTKAMMYAEYDTAPKGDAVPAPDIVAGSKGQADWVERVSGQPLTFHTVGQSQTVELIPLYKLFGEHYVVYWKVKSTA